MKQQEIQMRRTGGLEFAPEQREALARAKKLEWLTIGYISSAIVLLYLVLGSSQAMKTAWLEDILSLAPPIAFLVAARLFWRDPTQTHPYGFHSVVTVAFLVGAVALLFIGLYLAYDSGLKLFRQEHPTIGSIKLFGELIWLGWLMIPVLIYSAVPAVVLGHLKMPLAHTLHDKVLYTDAQINKADWMTAVAAIFGVLGIGLGYWWADSLAALLISLDIIHDGFKNVRNAVSDLLNSVPQTVERDKPDPLIRRVAETIENLDWAESSLVRLREEGHVYFGEAFVVPVDEQDPLQRIQDAHRQILDLDWRMHDFVITLVPELPEEQPRAGQEGAKEPRAGSGA